MISDSYYSLLFTVFVQGGAQWQYGGSPLWDAFAASGPSLNRGSIAFDPLFPAIGRLPRSIFPGQLGVTVLIFRVVAALHASGVLLVIV